MRKRINFPLLLGLIIVGTLIMMYFFPTLFTDKDPLYEDAPKYISVKENGEWIEKFGYNPMPPNKENIMGTDDAGRDVYTRLIYGTRNTMTLVFFVALFRMLLSFPLGIAGGMGVKSISWLIKVFNTFFTAVPILIFSYIILNIAYFKNLQMDLAIVAFAVVLTILGWAKLAGMIEDATRRVMAEDFIEGEIAIGKTKWHIAFQNVLPHLIPDAISLFFKEIGMAMFLIAQLAVFNVFVGVTREIKALSFNSNYAMILEPEWGGTLSRIAINMRKFDAVYWMTVFPILLFSIAIVGFNLIGEGLRLEFQNRNSRVISHIRRVFYALSPKLFISQIKAFKRYYKPVIAKLLVVAMIVLYFVIPWDPSQQLFETENALKHVKALINPGLKGRVSGSEGSYQAGEYIKSTLLSLGYQMEDMTIPYTKSLNEKFIRSDLTPVFVNAGSITIKKKDGTEQAFKLYEDFELMSISRDAFINRSVETLVYKGLATNAEEIAKQGLDVDENTQIIPLSYDYPYFQEYNAKQYSYFKATNKLNLAYQAEFYMPSNNFESSYGTQVFNTTTIYPFSELATLLKEGNLEVTVELDVPLLPAHDGRNLLAFLPGKGKTLDNPGEVIYIGASYDGLYSGGLSEPYAMSATPTAIALEVARIIANLDEPLEKSVQFIFWDNQAEERKQTKYSGAGWFHLGVMRDVEMATTNGFYYIDINYPGYSDNETLDITTLPAQRANGMNYLIGLEMEDRLKKMPVKYHRYHYEYGMTEPLSNLRLNALTSLGIGNYGKTSKNFVWDTYDHLNLDLMKAMGQLVVDTLTMNPYLMENKLEESEESEESEVTP